MKMFILALWPFRNPIMVYVQFSITAPPKTSVKMRKGRVKIPSRVIMNPLSDHQIRSTASIISPRLAAHGHPLLPTVPKKGPPALPTPTC